MQQLDLFPDDPARPAPPAPEIHSEEFVVMFLGWLTLELPELGGDFECPRLLEAWVKYKEQRSHEKVTR